MKRLFQIAVIVLGVLVLLGFGTVMYFQSRWPLAFPETPFPKIKASQDSAWIAEGKYLYLAVAHCNACHSAPGEYFHRLPEDMESLQPKGGYAWELGPLGTIRSRNITSHAETGIGKWTDAELARVIQYGIKPDHMAAPFMFAVGPMAGPDLTALISYLRTLPPVENKVEPTQFSWMGKVLLQTALKGFIQPKPQDPGLVYVPRGEESEARGRYLANGPGMCFGCHSESAMSPELTIVGPRFAGNHGDRGSQPDPSSRDRANGRLVPGRFYCAVSQRPQRGGISHALGEFPAHDGRGSGFSLPLLKIAGTYRSECRAGSPGKGLEAFRHLKKVNSKKYWLKEKQLSKKPSRLISIKIESRYSIFGSTNA